MSVDITTTFAGKSAHAHFHAVRAVVTSLRRQTSRRVPRIAAAMMVMGLAAGGAPVVVRRVVPAPTKGSVATVDYSKPEIRLSKKNHLPIEACSDPDQLPAINKQYHIACQQTANDILSAVPKWKKAMTVLRGQGVAWANSEIPSYIGDELAIRAAGIESDMGRLEKNPGTYSGLYQFSPTNKKALLFKQMSYMLEILNAGRNDISVLKNLKVSEITQKELLSDSVYYDHTVQVYLKMTSAYLGDREYSRLSSYQEMTPGERMAVGYIDHLLPVAGQFVIGHRGCGHRIKQFIYEVGGKLHKISPQIFKLNSGMLQRDGMATSSDIFSRFDALTLPYLVQFAPKVSRTSLSQHSRESDLSRDRLNTKPSVEKVDPPKANPKDKHVTRSSAPVRRPPPPTLPHKTPAH